MQHYTEIKYSYDPGTEITDPKYNFDDYMGGAKGIAITKLTEQLNEITADPANHNIKVYLWVYREKDAADIVKVIESFGATTVRMEKKMSTVNFNAVNSSVQRQISWDDDDPPYGDSVARTDTRLRADGPPGGSTKKADESGDEEEWSGEAGLW